MIKAIGTAQDNPPPDTSGAGRAAVAEPIERVEGQASDPPQGDVTPADIPLLTLEEKRRILAGIARVDPLDCFDDTGALDIAKAKRILPPGSIRHISVHETTRLDAEGQPVTERLINVRLVDPVSALRLDDLLERRRERTASRSHSDSTSGTKNFSRRDFKLLTEKTMALDDTNQSIELLKKALAEAGDRHLQLTNELAEKDRQLSQTLSKVEGEAAQGSGTGLQRSDQSSQHDTGCQPVEAKSPSLSKTLSLSNVPPSQTLGEVEGKTLSSAEESKPLNNVEGGTLSEAEKIAKKRKASMARREAYEIECRRNTLDHEAFTAWLRSKGLDPANYPPPPPPHQRLGHQTPAHQPARPPPP